MIFALVSKASAGRRLVPTLCLVTASFSVASLPSAASAIDHVTFRRDGVQATLEGRIVVEAQDGGLMLQTSNGRLWTIPPEEQVTVRSDDVPFRPLTQAEMAKQLLAELPEGFRTLSTANYLIAYDTSKPYAEWCASLFERLYLAFNNYWQRRGFDLEKPEFPLVAVIFADRNRYVAYSRGELGEAAGAIVGYYSLRTNRMNMYDMTGIETTRARSRQQNAPLRTSQILATPGAAASVATIVHEATHQIAFNGGLHQRYSDCPLWFSEGIAMYFETPDLTSTRGWRTIGGVNRPRLVRFLQLISSRTDESLASLIKSDDRLRDTEQTLDAYAESWALTYFLLQQKPREYVQYLQTLSEKKPLIWDDEEGRIKEFEAAFGPIEEVEKEFVQFMRRVR